MHNFTSNDLLLYIFNEVPSDTRLEIETALTLHATLKEEYLALQQTLNDVENYELVPNERILDNIITRFRQKEDMHIV